MPTFIWRFRCSRADFVPRIDAGEVIRKAVPKDQPILIDAIDKPLREHSVAVGIDLPPRSPVATCRPGGKQRAVASDVQGQ